MLLGEVSALRSLWWPLSAGLGVVAGFIIRKPASRLWEIAAGVVTAKSGGEKPPLGRAGSGSRSSALGQQVLG